MLRAALLSGVRRLLRVEPLVLFVLVLAVCTLYFWTAYSSPPGTGYYQSLTDGFLAGQTHMSVDPPPELLALPDPYDPVQNAPYRLNDASLFEGRYYLYFGPTPVVLAHLPLRLVGVWATDELVGALFASIGFLFALALMRFLVQRYRPQTSLTTKLGAGLLFGLASVAPFALRRPSYYEEAISAGYCCLLAALFLTLTGALRPRPHLVRLAGGSLALGLAVGARPHLILAVPLFLWAWHKALRSRWDEPKAKRDVLRLGAVMTVPLTACLVLLAVYNFVRFGSAIEFGQTYQLAGINPSTLDRFDLDRLVPGLFFYLLAPPAVDLVFPFAHLDPSYPGALSAEYGDGIEPVAGVFATTPILILALAAPVLLARDGRGRGEDMALASLLTVTAVLILAPPLLSFDGATMRYEMDFATLLILSALLVWLRFEGLLAVRPFARGAARALVGTAVLVAVLFGLAFSITGYHDGLRQGSPDAYARIESAFDWVPTLASRIRGEPVALQTTPLGIPTAETTLRLVAPSAGVVDIQASFLANPAVGEGSVVALRVQGSDGVTRRVPLVVVETTVRAGLSRGGPQEVRIWWDLVRYTGRPAADGLPPAGFGVVDPTVVRWASD